MKKAILMATLATFTFGAFAQTAQPSGGALADSGKKHKRSKRSATTPTATTDSSSKKM